MQSSDFKNEIFTISSEQDFNAKCLEIFSFQAKNNPVYREFLDKIGFNPKSITNYLQIPFLPISFFKTHRISCIPGPEKLIFTSSGTSGVQSKHYVHDFPFYLTNTLRTFEYHYGPVSDYEFFALLPGYLDRKGSSLIDMVQYFITKSGNEGGFFLHNHTDLAARLKKNETENKKSLLIGVTYALLDFATEAKLKLNNTIVMETGGMKGKRKEIPRAEVHQLLKETFGVSSVHSEYGMTELFSQAYSKGDGCFTTPPWMKVLIRETNDPFSWRANGKSGGVNIIDLANVDSVSFIATDDLGKNNGNNFEILGRIDHCDIRGCNLMIE